MTKVVCGEILNCVYGDWLRDAAAKGDVAALRKLADCAPLDIPKAAKIAHRNADLRLLAVELRAAMPGNKTRAVALIISQAGHDLVRGRRLTGRRPYHELDAEERAELQERVKALLNRFGELPNLRQMLSILSVQSNGVAIAHADGVASGSEENR